MIGQARVFHVEGHHLAQAETEHRDGFSGFRGKGIEVEHKDAHQRVGEYDGDGAGARRDLAERCANGRRDHFGSTQIGLANVGDQCAGRERLEGVDRGLAGTGERGGEHAVGRKLHRDWGAPAGLGRDFCLVQD